MEPQAELKEADKEDGAPTPDQGTLRYEYTGKRSERSAYIAERAKLAHGLTQAEVLQLQYPGREGLMLAYNEKGRPQVRYRPRLPQEKGGSE